MESRFNYVKAAPGAYKAMQGLEQYLHECGIEESLIHLIKLRASQINGCAYCQGHALEGPACDRRNRTAAILAGCMAGMFVLYGSRTRCSGLDGPRHPDYQWARF